LTKDLIKLSEKNIIVGRILPWSVYDSNGTLLLKQGFVLHSAQQIERLISRGSYINKQALLVSQLAEPNKILVQKAEDSSPFVLLDKVTTVLLEKVTSELAITLAPRDVSKTDFTAEVMALVKNVQRACDHDASAAIASLFILEGYSYPIKHAVDVAVLSEILAVRRGVSRKDRQSLVAAALTMNIAMVELQELLYRQQTPLTAEQKKAIHEHPMKGVEMLRRANVKDELWLECVGTHHESISGTGYPNKLNVSQFPLLAQFITIADVYCARLSPRAHRSPLLHKGILRDILCQQGHMVEPKVAALFIKILGFYPPGLTVQLMNTEIGVVTKQGNKIDTPIVHAFMKPKIGAYTLPVQRNTELDEYKILRIVSSDDPDVTFDRRKVWGFKE
jgi:HD-GYP domain-containing protein (c-di-GMP phosphodiesterase class II)